jgi:histidine triad (HIT) family protein
MGTVPALLFRLARTPLFGILVRFGFAHLSGLIPVRRVRSNVRVVAFHHPRPAWRHHLLFVPKVGIPSLLAARLDQVPLLRDVLLAALECARDEPFASAGFALMVNGGAYQDVGQVHAHLAAPAPEAWLDKPTDVESATALLARAQVRAVHHPRPHRTTHVVLLPTLAHLHGAATDGRAEYIEAAIRATQELVVRLGLAKSGYTLVVGGPPGTSPDTPCFHLVAGERLA